MSSVTLSAVEANKSLIRSLLESNPRISVSQAFSQLKQDFENLGESFGVSKKSFAATFKRVKSQLKAEIAGEEGVTTEKPTETEPETELDPDLKKESTNIETEMSSRAKTTPGRRSGKVKVFSEAKENIPDQGHQLSKKLDRELETGRFTQDQGSSRRSSSPKQRSSSPKTANESGSNHACQYVDPAQQPIYDAVIKENASGLRWANDYNIQDMNEKAMWAQTLTEPRLWKTYADEFFEPNYIC